MTRKASSSPLKFRTITNGGAGFLMHRLPHLTMRNLDTKLFSVFNGAVRALDDSHRLVWLMVLHFARLMSSFAKTILCHGL